MASFMDYLGGVGSGAAGGALAGSTLGPMGALGGGVLGGLLGGFGTYKTSQAGDARKAAIDAAIGQTRDNGRQMQQFYAGAENRAMGHIEPLQDLYRHFYGSAAPGVGQTPPAPAPPQANPLQSMFGGKR